MQILKTIWDFFQYQVLAMKWLDGMIGRGLSAIGLDTSARLGGSIEFFLYDVIKITILLCSLIFLISYIQSYFHRSAVNGFSVVSMVFGQTAFRRFLVR